VTAPPPLRIVAIGLTITSSWGNGHATNYRALVRALVARGHRVSFLERDAPWYAANQDDEDLPGEVARYGSVDELRSRHGDDVATADLVIVGSYVPDGIAVASWVTEVARGVTAFYDIDTPVTIEALEAGDCAYLSPELVPAFDLYLSFTGGPLLGRLASIHGARRPIAFHCFVDPERHRPVPAERRLDLGYLGTYSADRQPALDALLVEPARRRPAMSFAVAGPLYPADHPWPPNVARIEHLPPPMHPGFYAAQRFTLSVTRAAMLRTGHSPSVRLFEAAACGVPVITDPWPGLAEHFVPGREILVASGPGEVLEILGEVGDGERAAIGRNARERVLAEHTADERAQTLEREVAAVAGGAGRRG
jgi:spore maturation protein CgeB